MLLSRKERGNRRTWKVLLIMRGPAVEKARRCRVPCGVLDSVFILGCFVGFGFSFAFLAFVLAWCPCVYFQCT
jgi:hypothetical protein